MAPRRSLWACAVVLLASGDYTLRLACTHALVRPPASGGFDARALPWVPSPDPNGAPPLPSPPAGLSVAAAAGCPAACALSAKPVCGEDGMPYLSACVAACAGVRVKHEGYCAKGAPAAGPRRASAWARRVPAAASWAGVRLCASQQRIRPSMAHPSSPQVLAPAPAPAPAHPLQLAAPAGPRSPTLKLAPRALFARRPQPPRPGSPRRSQVLGLCRRPP